MRVRDLHGPVASSVFAALLGAGVVDALVTLVRAGGGAGVALLALGLYGVAGLVAGPLAGVMAGGIRDAIPGGWTALRDDEALDRAAAAGVLAALAAALVLSGGVAAGYGAFVAGFESKRLATIAVGGLVLMLAPVAGALGLICLRGARAWAAVRLPRPARLGATGVLLLLLSGAAALAFVAALSRADWRVLDLGPLAALAAAGLLGAAHGLFWYASARGRALHARLPERPLKGAAAALVLLFALLASRAPEGAPVYAAAQDGSLGLRLGLRVARRLTDGDGDGYSARFGGGDCDDRRADVFPGAEDVPGDGVDQDCEGGDAKPMAEEPAPAPGPGSRGGPSATPAPTGAPPATPAPDGSAKPGAGTPAPAGGKGAPFAFASQGNILLVTIDALRGDRLGVAGYRRDGKSLTPNLDALAARGAYFKRVWSQAPNTPRSFPSIITSRYPSDIAWQKQSLNYSPILPSNLTAFEELTRAGLRCIGIFSHFYFTPDRGISQGFAEWSDDGAGSIADSNKDVASPRIVPRVAARLKTLAASHERFVLWTHLFEPHSSYMPHKEFPARLSGVEGLQEKYDYEIAFVDLWVGKLLAALTAAGLDATTTVVVAADHGEAWGEHKQLFHGTDLFDEQLRVPLIVAVPGRAPVIDDQPAALVDVAPTLLDLAGVAAPAPFRGQSLLARALGTSSAAAPRPVFAELLPATAWPHHAVAMVWDGKKLIHRISERRWELYELAADPGEKKNLADDPARAQVLDDMKRRIVQFEERRR